MCYFKSFVVLLVLLFLIWFCFLNLFIRVHGAPPLLSHPLPRPTPSLTGPHEQQAHGYPEPRDVIPVLRPHRTLQQAGLTVPQGLAASSAEGTCSSKHRARLSLLVLHFLSRLAELVSQGLVSKCKPFHLLPKTHTA